MNKESYWSVLLVDCSFLKLSLVLP
jgi:hypothetical protein